MKIVEKRFLASGLGCRFFSHLSLPSSLSDKPATANKISPDCSPQTPSNVLTSWSRLAEGSKKNPVWQSGRLFQSGPLDPAVSTQALGLEGLSFRGSVELANNGAFCIYQFWDHLQHFRRPQHAAMKLGRSLDLGGRRAHVNKASTSSTYSIMYLQATHDPALQML